MIITIWILCAYRPMSAFIMINSNLDQKTIDLAGSMDEVGTECAAILRQILQQNQKSWGNLGAQGVLVNIFMLALTGQTDDLHMQINWKQKEDMFKNNKTKEEQSALVMEQMTKAMKDGFFVDQDGNQVEVQHLEQEKDDNLINKLSETGNVNAIWDGG